MSRSECVDEFPEAINATGSTSRDISRGQELRRPCGFFAISLRIACRFRSVRHLEWTGSFLTHQEENLSVGIV